ncbi:unnamed protein product [Arabidopsis lyrata]|nr:unnamed protein product [Arabidopsis lyrata]
MDSSSSTNNAGTEGRHLPQSGLKGLQKSNLKGTKKQVTGGKNTIDEPTITNGATQGEKKNKGNNRI